MTPERELRTLVAEWRYGRATKSFLEAFTDGYVVVFAIAMVVAMVGNVIWQSHFVVGECTTDSCHVARILVPRVLLAASIAATLATASLFGPVVASAAEGFWLLSAPIRRGRLLAGRLYAIVAATTAIGVVFGFVVPLLTGVSWQESLLWSVAIGLSAGAVMAIAAAEQVRHRPFVTVWLQRAATIAAVVLALLLIVDSAGWVHVGPWILKARFHAPVVICIAGVALPLALVTARRRLDAIRRVSLTSGGALVNSLSGAMFGLDLGLVRDIVVARRAIARGCVVSRRGGPTRAAQLVWREWQLMLRHPTRFLTLAATVIVPWALISLGLAVIAVPISAFTLAVVLIPTCQGLRVFHRTPGLVRMIPLSIPTQRAVMLLIPTALALLWGLLALPAFLGVVGPVRWAAVDAVLVVVVVVVAGLVGAARWTLSTPIDWTAPLLTSPAGAIPTGMFGNLLRGTDFVLIITIWVVAGFSPIVSLIVAGICVNSVLGWLDVPRLRAAKERQERLAQQARLEAQQSRRRKRR